MSSTGYWLVGAARPEIVDHLRRTLPTALFEPLPEDADLGWWRAMDQGDLLAPPEPGYTFPGLSRAAWRFAESFEAQRPDPDARDVCMNAFEQIPQAGIYHVGVRKGDPVAAVYYGLGYHDAHVLPGRFGCFLLAPGDVRTALAGLEHLPDQPVIGRAAFEERTAAWLSAAADEPGLDPSGLLEGPLRILRHAREQHLGAIGFMQWY